MITKKLIKKLNDIAQDEIQIYKAPSPVHFSLSYNKGQEIAEKLGARKDLVALGTICMDIKLGQAIIENRLTDHVEMSLEYTKSLLENTIEISQEELSIIYNSIEAHHGGVSHNSLESEIVTNADCYRFIHPLGVTWWNATLGTRSQDIKEILNNLSYKLEEKWALATLPIVKSELEPYYEQYKKLFQIVQNSI